MSVVLPDRIEGDQISIDDIFKLDRLAMEKAEELYGKIKTII